MSTFTKLSDFGKVTTFDLRLPAIIQTDAVFGGKPHKRGDRFETKDRTVEDLYNLWTADLIRFEAPAPTTTIAREDAAILLAAKSTRI